MHKSIFRFGWGALGLFGLFLAASVWAETAVVVFGRDLAPYREVEAGFKAEGSYQSRVFNLQINSPEEVLKSSADGAGIALVIGAEAIQALKDSAWPVKTLFTMTVTQPDDATFAGGILMTIPVKKQLETLRLLLPRAKTLAMVYDPAYSASFMAEMRDLAPTLEFTINTGVISSPQEINTSLTKITAGGVDAIVMVVDQTTGQPKALEELIRFGLDKKIVLVGQSIFHAKAGTAAALGIDFQDVGRQAALLAGRVVSESNSGPLIESPRKIVLYVNAETATQIGRRDLLTTPGVVRVD